MSDTRIIELTVPRLGETMEEGAVRDWLKAAGERFERGDAIVEIETDKTIAEVPAMMAGRLVEIQAESGQTLEVGATLALIEVAAEDAPDEPERAASSGDHDDSRAELRGERMLDDRSDTAPVARRVTGQVRATPAARRLARHAGLDIRSLSGTGRRGRIESQDVRRATAGAASVRSPVSSAVDDGGTPGGVDAGRMPLQRLGDIAYVTSGPDGGEPTVLLHGFAADHSVWAGLMQALSRAGRRVWVPDLPGHGATALEANAPDQLSAQLGEFVETCAGSQPCHLVAHSLGAAAAVSLAEHVSVASLTLIAPAGMGSSIDAPFLRGMASPGSAGELAHLLRRLGDRDAALSQAAIDMLYAQLSRGRLRVLAESMLGEIGQTLDLVPAIEALARRVPVRVIVGHRDRIVDWRDACRLSTRVAVHHFPNAGHMPHRDSTREVAGILVDRS